MPRDPVLVVCLLVRDLAPEGPAGPGRREFCAGCRSRVWISQTSIDAAHAADGKPLPYCAPCARLAMSPDQEAEFLAASDAAIREVAAARGITEDEARSLADDYLAAWRRGDL